MAETKVNPQLITDPFGNTYFANVGTVTFSYGIDL